MTERRRRLASGLAQVIPRLEACQSRASAGRPDPRLDLETLLVDAREFEATLSARTRPNTFDHIEAGFDLIYRDERTADRACGSPEPLDRALSLIGRLRGLEDQ